MFQRTVLENGLSILSSQMPHTRSISMAIFIGAGSRYEAENQAGMSHFLEHLPFKGTKNWPTAQHVSEAIEGVGGILNASTDREITVFWCKVAAPHFDRAVSVLTDMVLNPLMDPVEIEKERQVVIEELRMSNDQPGFRADLLIDEALWPEQAMGRDVGGTVESVEAILQEDINEYMAHQYIPGNTVVAVAGNISHEEVIDHMDRSLGSWQRGNALSWLPVEDRNGQPNVRFERRKTDQTYLCVGLPGLSLDHPDRHALNLANIVLGGGMSSRLFQEIRENQSLAYDIHSSASFYRDCGSLVVSCSVEPTKGQRAVSAILDQLKALQETITENELEKARELSKGRLLLRMEDTRSVAMWMGAQEALQGEVRTADEVVEAMEQVTTADLNRVCGDIISEDHLNLAVVGPHRSMGPFQRLLKL